MNGSIPDRFSLFGYDDRSQLTGSQRYEGTDLNDQDTPVDLQQYEFEYDTIGNRKSYTADGVLEGVKTYTSNNLNQYTETESLAESFAHDADGNLTEDGEYTYVWDAENRLIEVKPTYPESMRRPSRIKMQYDYLGRRIRKVGYEWQTGGLGTPGSWPTNPTSDTRFVYDGWNLLMELDGLNSNAVLRQYTWGLDLSGQNGNPSVGGLHGAGGIGGLLAMRSGSGTSSTADDGSYLYFYNANGDIGQLMKTSNEGGGYGTTAARFEYYPFGGDLVSVFSPSSASNPARNNPFRFSTKYRDNESKCYYYGYRYLRPKHGRWISRDPIGEADDIHVYRLIRNTPTNVVDLLGLGGPRLHTGDFGPVGDVEDPEWGVPSLLGIQVIIPAHPISDCGGGEYEVKWTLPVSKNDQGWIIQHIRETTQVVDCMTGMVLKHIEREFWEAWRVTGGTVKNGDREDMDGGHDNFRNPDQGKCTRGSSITVGEVRWMRDYNLEYPPWNHDLGMITGALPSRTTPPEGWNSTSSGLTHSMTCTWNCCEGKSSTHCWGTP